MVSKFTLNKITENKCEKPKICLFILFKAFLLIIPLSPILVVCVYLLVNNYYIHYHLQEKMYHYPNKKEMEMLNKLHKNHTNSNQSLIIENNLFHPSTFDKQDCFGIQRLFYETCVKQYFQKYIGDDFINKNINDNYLKTSLSFENKTFTLISSPQKDYRGYNRYDFSVKDGNTTLFFCKNYGESSKNHNENNLNCFKGNGVWNDSWID